MTSIVVIQARTSSSRLPAKVLLPIAGLPIVVLAAKRAANTGRKVIVATSLHESDDGLVDVLQRYGLAHYRGSLENTLARYVEALNEFEDETIVFRLTADNVVPDGSLIDEIETDFLSRELEYLACNGSRSGLPYGVSVEVTRLSHLREAHRISQNKHDSEHVTPYVIRKFGPAYFEKYIKEEMGDYRCTVDVLDDYLSVERLFRDIADPIDVGAIELTRRLKGAGLQPQVNGPANKLVLGTAQLGLKYGIANVNGQPSLEVSRQLIRTAIANGVKYVDTARAYGDSEEVIRHALIGGWQDRVHIVTKLAPLEDCPQDGSTATINAFVDGSLFHSMSALGVQKLDTLLLHRASHLHAWNGDVWKRLIEHRESGTINKLGVSIQNLEELILSLCDKDVSHLQIPFNLLDYRWDTIDSKIERAKADRNVTIHVRSVLLQGLINSRDIDLWKKAHVCNPEILWHWLDGMQKRFGRISLVDLSIAFAAGIPWVDGIVIGAETIDQLSQNLDCLENPPLDVSEVQYARATRPRIDARSIDPALWMRDRLCV